MATGEVKRRVAGIAGMLLLGACAARPERAITPRAPLPPTASSTSAPVRVSPSDDEGSAGTEPTRSLATPEAAPAEPAVARFEALPVTGHLDAVVALPAASGPQPVLFATHGAGGAPEHHCVAWRRQLGDRGIVVCPRGAMVNRIVGPDAGFYYPNHFALEKEVLATLESFEAAYSERILPESYVYAGYSQGATMGALMLPAHAGRFKRIILVEGGFDDWALSSALKFAQNGGERVAFVCGVAACKRGAEKSLQILARAELLSLSRHAPGAGHTYLGPVADRIQEAFRWLVDGHPGWQPIAATKRGAASGEQAESG